MAKKATPTNKPSAETNNVAEPTPAAAVPVDVPVADAVVEKPKKKRTKKTAPVAEEVATTPETVNVETPVATPVVDNVEINVETTDVAVEGSTTTTEKKKRRLVTKDSFFKSSEEFQKELTVVLEETNNKKLLKTFKVLLNDAYRLLKIKTHQKKQKDATNSGFMRPVKPSETLEKFLTHIGENSSTQPLTRAHLTTIICKYIKDNNLQNPKDRRIIFPDEEFKKLFQITENDTEPLTYYNIQKRIQTHISRIEDVVA